ncbi:predicted protein [Aspergillus nidulans FGSC A4]|uniref:Uncharacterized protein n=1 Tax=Emericella nidulans (strain FGSC A4 / ATCC 38163 / CBS 112.46 / NRRL 194 / M139) TaxID=227321 RepID=Q5ASV4_EMENI|nr:hypothetical protein [Aspergillus nidulans FGSC A4]EAA60660.1 predicted protein [Aspergillus nidulans FGSC A4]CBF78303.1 TPA: conserved hypothetical protein [Aspergillus nidulans FGSC A4]|eukprot:XP_681895.1 predicted protein [Aspergillus nidulans FGSC A4]
MSLLSSRMLRLPREDGSKTARPGPRCFTSAYELEGLTLSDLCSKRFTEGQQKGISDICLYPITTHSKAVLFCRHSPNFSYGWFYIVNDWVNTLPFICFAVGASEYVDHSNQHRSFTSSPQKMERVNARDEHSSDIDSLSNARTTKTTKKPFNLEQYDSIEARTNRANISQRPTELSRQRADKEAQCGHQTYDAVNTRVVYNASSKPCSDGQSPVPFPGTGSDRQRNNQRVELGVHVLDLTYTEQSTLGLNRKSVKTSSPLFKFISFIASRQFDQYRQYIFDQHILKSTGSLTFLSRKLMGLLFRNEIAGRGASSLYIAPLECSSYSLGDDAASPKPVTRKPTPAAPTASSPIVTSFSRETVSNKPSNDARSWETTTSQATPTPKPSNAGYKQIQYKIVGYQGDGLEAPIVSTRPAGRPPSNTIYQIYVGIADETEEESEHYAVVVRTPPHFADPMGDCAWYHCIGWGIEETNHYRRVVDEPQPFKSSYLKRRIGVGIMTEAQRQDFRRAFRQTPPQSSEFFCIHFMRKLVKTGIIQPYQIQQIESEVGEPPAELEWDPDYCDSPDFGPETLDYEGNIPIFEMEDIDRV